MYLANAAKVSGRLLGRVPFRFDLCRLLGQQDLRCVLFHDVSDIPGNFADQLGVTISPERFECVIRALATNYNPVSLDAVLSCSAGAELPGRPVLVTFDDSYASVATVAAEICQKYKVPAIFFVNSRYLGNHELALDNLLSYIANVFGLMPIIKAARSLGTLVPQFSNLNKFFSNVLPKLSLADRRRFEHELISVSGVDPWALAEQARLYMSEAQVRDLASSAFEIGNHTYSHVNCRVLEKSEFELEIGLNKSELERITGKRVRAFSVPYGSRHDLTPELSQFLKSTGHEAAFLVESAANTRNTDPFNLSRVSISAPQGRNLFSELELLPRLRSLRNAMLRTSSSNPYGPRN